MASSLPDNNSDLEEKIREKRDSLVKYLRLHDLLLRHAVLINHVLPDNVRDNIRKKLEDGLRIEAARIFLDAFLESGEVSKWGAFREAIQLPGHELAVDILCGTDVNLLDKRVELVKTVYNNPIQQYTEVKEVLTRLTSFSRDERERINCELERRGNSHAIPLIIDFMICHKNWFAEFLGILEQLGKHGLAKQLRESGELDYCSEDSPAKNTRSKGRPLMPYSDDPDKLCKEQSARGIKLPIQVSDHYGGARPKFLTQLDRTFQRDEQSPELLRTEGAETAVPRGNAELISSSCHKYFDSVAEARPQPKIAWVYQINASNTQQETNTRIYDQGMRDCADSISEGQDFNEKGTFGFQSESSSTIKMINEAQNTQVKTPYCPENSTEEWKCREPDILNETEVSGGIGFHTIRPQNKQVHREDHNVIADNETLSPAHRRIHEQQIHGQPTTVSEDGTSREQKFRNIKSAAYQRRPFDKSYKYTVPYQQASSITTTTTHEQFVPETTKEHQQGLPNMSPLHQQTSIDTDLQALPNTTTTHEQASPYTFNTFQQSLPSFSKMLSSDTIRQNTHTAVTKHQAVSGFTQKHGHDSPSLSCKNPEVLNTNSQPSSLPHKAAATHPHVFRCSDCLDAFLNKQARDAHRMSCPSKNPKSTTSEKDAKEPTKSTYNYTSSSNMSNFQSYSNRKAPMPSSSSYSSPCQKQDICAPRRTTTRPPSISSHIDTPAEKQHLATSAKFSDTSPLKMTAFHPQRNQKTSRLSPTSGNLHVDTQVEKLHLVPSAKSTDSDTSPLKMTTLQPQRNQKLSRFTPTPGSSSLPAQHCNQKRCPPNQTDFRPTRDNVDVQNQASGSHSLPNLKQPAKPKIYRCAKCKTCFPSETKKHSHICHK